MAVAAAPTVVPFRTIKFFETETLKTSIDGLEITAATCGRHLVIFGDNDGYVRSYDRSTLKSLVHEFRAYDNAVTHMKMVRGAKSVLVTVGDDQSEVAVVRLWNLDDKNLNGERFVQHKLFDARSPPPGERFPIRTNFNADLILKWSGNAVKGAEDGNQSTAGGRSTAAGGAAAAAGPQTAQGDTVTSTSVVSCIVTFDVTDDLQYFVAALANDDIIVLRGDLDSDRAKLRLKRFQSKFGKKLTFVGFPRIKSDSAGTGSGAGSFAMLLYAVFEKNTTVFNIPHKVSNDNYDERCFDQPIGAAYECAAINDEGQLHVAITGTNQIAIVGGEQFVQMKRDQWEGDFPVWKWTEVEGDKRKISFHKSYVLILSKADGPGVAATAASIAGPSGAAPIDRRPDKFQVALYDCDARIRAVTTVQGAQSNVAWLLPDTSDVIVIAQDPKSDRAAQKVTRFVEVDLQNKLDQLFKRDLYDEAKRIASRHGGGAGAAARSGAGSKGAAGGARPGDHGTVSDDDAQLRYAIQRKYGDHLYEKGKFDQAIEQYIEAIHGTEPSYVIRKFLDAQRVKELTKYLEHLHRRENERLVNVNHTTLLLNCYAKLKDQEKLSEFIQRDDIAFDAVNAISVCCQAGYHTAATLLAKKYNQPALFVQIQIETLRNHQEALQFVRGLPLGPAEDILHHHGKTLLAIYPAETTEAIVAICTNWKPTPTHQASATAPAAAGAGDKLLPSRSTTVAAAAAVAAPTTIGQFAAPDAFIPCFLDSPLWLLHFLKQIVAAHFRPTTQIAAATQLSKFDAGDVKVLFNTLLELCLTKELKSRIKQSSSVTPMDASMTPPEVVESYDRRLDRALRVLDDFQGLYCPHHALMLVRQHNFEKGILAMFRNLNMQHEIFQYHAKEFESGATKDKRDAAKRELFAVCEAADRAKNEASRRMWTSLVSLLVRSKDDCSADVTQLLQKVEQDDLLPPVAVVDMLGSCAHLQLRAVRSYIVSMIKREQQKIDRLQVDVADLTEKNRKCRDEITELQTSAVVFQSSKCQICSGPLDLPAVHFLCRHSYHQRCLNDIRECTVCGPEQRRIMLVQKEFEERSDDHDAFFSALRSRSTHDASASGATALTGPSTSAGTDVFSVIAEQFGKGIFSAGPRTSAQRRGGAAVVADEDDDDEGLGNDSDEEDESAIIARETW